MAQNDGGPAFPQEERVAEVAVVSGGMTLRDYFAAKALLHFNSKESRAEGKRQDLTADEIDGVIARASYLMADAMIKERSRV